ncbi:DUF7344 domain-containing protein [Natronobacterium texcoconense]|uniref:DUF7344 domain-containing protein n=1 Tax=Natronobacterium texcoconense TaxID=1095778 RepID=A0A1H1IE98_NATTX|nr:hypothetical protein [Natronobacterium texcoconense]SDR36063.1 hypothetical protein SAMN04489842_3489 [Natronobacterium texcoconense]
MKSCRNPELVDEFLTVLSDCRRRTVVLYLRDTTDGTATFPELATQLATNCSNARDEDAEMIRLVHQVLPALVDHSVVEYDVRSEVVRYRPTAFVEDVFECLEEYGPAGNE